MEFIGVRGTALSWINSYLSARKQYVEFGNAKCSLENIVCGVPQGSMLGPLLFVIYMNDICSVSNILKFVLFADDTTILASDKNVTKLCSEANR